MIQRRLLSFIFVLLFAFAQQQALVHPYVHLADEQASAIQTSNHSEKHNSPHSEVCSKCISLADIGSALHAHAAVIHILASTAAPALDYTQADFTNHFLPYRSRAPPSLLKT